MRRWYLVPLLLVCLLTAWGATACSIGKGSQAGATTTLAQADATTTTDIPTTTTTLAPATWQALAPEGTLPAARLGGSLVYLAQGNKLALFGGWAGGTKYYADLWTYDLTTDAWAKLKHTGTAPTARASQAMAYDPTSDKLVVFGGYDGTTYYNDTWVYDFTAGTWTAAGAAGTGPAARQGHSLVYDPVSKKMILFGGYDGSTEYNDTWAYDPAAGTWKDLKPEGNPPAARDSQALAYDSDDKVMVLFGGWSTTTQYNDTWAYDPADNSWNAIQTTGVVPAARALSQMVYDPSIKRLVLFGGGTSSATFNDLWLFDYSGRSWAPGATTGDTPSIRAGHGLVYDSSAGTIVLFGGSNGIGDYLDDLWSLHR
jgi:N-acetylneuraminic acid mutarotase